MEQPTESVRIWSRHYESIVLVGWLCALLAAGKMLSRLATLPVVLPPAVLGGVLGCAMFHLAPGAVQLEMGDGMTEIIVNLINFVFVGLILGFASSSSYVPKMRAVVNSVFHEALPMLIYSQVLIWGQSACALSVGGLFHQGNSAISPLLGALVCLGLETGRDVPAGSLAPWAQEVVALADSVGLTVSLTIGFLLVTAHNGTGYWSRRTSGRYSLVPGTPDNLSISSVHGNNGGGSGGGGGSAGGGGAAAASSRGQMHREHFQRGHSIHSEADLSSLQKQPSFTSSRGRSFNFGARKGISARSLGGGGHGSAGNLLEMADEDGSAAGGRSPPLPVGRSRSLSPPMRSFSVVSLPAAAGGASTVAAGLGEHITLLAVSVFFAWAVDLCVRLVEMRLDFTSRHHVVSGFRLFKLAMCIGLTLICVARRVSPLRYKSEWFFRVSGLSLDLMAVAAISGISFQAIPEELSLGFAAATLACLGWNAFVFLALGSRMFPNYWYLRAVTCIGDALGHSWVGLLLLRTMDPQLHTPVPLALASKMLLFFVPASGGKNSIVIGMVDVVGLWPAALLCVGVTALWLYVFEVYAKPRMPQHHAAASAGDVVNSPFHVAEGGAAAALSSRAEVEMSMGRTSPSPVPKAGVERVGAGGALAPRQSIGGGGALVPRLELDEPSQILKEPQLRKLASVLPAGGTLHTWSLIYSLTRDGASLSTLLWNCVHDKDGGADGEGPSLVTAPKGGLLIVIEDSYSYCFGGFAAAPLEVSSDYTNTGECFVFTFHPAFASYTWTGGSPFFVLCNETCLAMGGGGGGFAFCLDDELDTGTSNPSATYGNPRLASGEFFKVLNVEVWAANESRYAL